MKILHRDDMMRGCLAGLREHRLVTDTRIFGEHHEYSKAWDGIGNFVYLADERFGPKGETQLHNHKEIDVISVMVEGRIMHEGGGQNGQQLENYHVQAQRAGGYGFSQNEVNPDNVENRMVQLWVLPERPRQQTEYKLYVPKEGELTRIYGGAPNQYETFDSHTLIDIGIIPRGKNITLKGAFIAYIIGGSGVLEGQLVKDGDLIRSEDLEFTAGEAVHIIIIRNKI